MRLRERSAGQPGRSASGGQRWDWLWWPTIVGTLASLVVAVAASVPDSPFKLDAAGTWPFGEPAGAAQSPTVAMVWVAFAGFAGLVALVHTWLHLVRRLRAAPGAPLSRLWLLLACWCIPMLVIAPLLSRDLFSYAAQGEMVTRHIDPYLHGPGALGSSAFARPVDKLWINAPTPYGPLFLVLAGWIVRLTGHDLVPSLILLRLLAVLGVALIALAVPQIARRCGHDPGLAFGVGAASPLVVVTLVGGGHNDALMAGLLAVGVWFALAGRRVWAIVIMACAAAIKAPALLGVVMLAWTWNGIQTKARVRAVALAGGLALSTAVLALWSAAAGFGIGWLNNLADNGAVKSWAAPATGLGTGLTDVSRAFGAGLTTAGGLTIARLFCLALAAAICVVVLWRIDRFGFVGGLGLMLTAVAVLSPVLQPWYLCWGLVLLACVTGDWPRRICLVLASVSPFLGLPGGVALGHALTIAAPGLVAVLAAGLFLLVMLPFGGRTVRSSARSKATGA